MIKLIKATLARDRTMAQGKLAVPCGRNRLRRRRWLQLSGHTPALFAVPQNLLLGRHRHSRLLNQLQEEQLLPVAGHKISRFSFAEYSLAFTVRYPRCRGDSPFSKGTLHMPRFSADSRDEQPSYILFEFWTPSGHGRKKLSGDT
jgi:hypothetical protein